MEPVRKKRIGIIVTTGIFGLLTFLLVGLAVAGAFSVTAAGIVVLLFAAALACAYGLLHEWKAGQYMVSVITVIIALVVGMFSLTSLIGSVLLFAFISSGAYLITTAVHSGVKFKLQSVFLPALRMIVAGIAIMVIVLVLPTVRQYIGNGGIRVDATVIAYVSGPATPLVQSIFPGYSTDQTVNEIIDDEIKQQTQSLPPGYEIPPQQKAIAIRNLSETLGVSLTGEEKAPDVLAAVINNYIQKISTVDGVLVTFILAGLGLLAIRALVPIVSWLALGFVSIMFLLAKRFNFIVIQKQQLPVDRLTL